MKKADLKKAIAAKTVIAVAPGYVARGEYPRNAYRATVVAVGQKRRVFSGARWDMAGHIAEDGVRIRYESDVPTNGGLRPISSTEAFGRRDLYEETADRIVAPHSCIAPWDEYETERDRLVAIEADKSQSREAREAHFASVAERLAHIAGTARVARTIPRRPPWESQLTGIELPIEAAERVLALLEDCAR